MEFIKIFLGVAFSIMGLIGMLAFDTQDAKFTQAIVIWVGGLILILN